MCFFNYFYTYTRWIRVLHHSSIPFLFDYNLIDEFDEFWLFSENGIPIFLFTSWFRIGKIYEFSINAVSISPYPERLIEWRIKESILLVPNLYVTLYVMIYLYFQRFWLRLFLQFYSGVFDTTLIKMQTCFKCISF